MLIMSSLTAVDILRQNKKPSILVIGEAMLDSYLYGESERICREAPVPIVDIKKIINRPGGAANTAANLSQMGVTTYFVSVVGTDEEGEILRNALHNYKINTSFVFSDKERKTIIKKRVLASDQLLVRYDSGSVHPLSQNVEKKIVNNLIDLYPAMDAIIISDYAYGIVTPRIIETFIKLKYSLSKIFVIDAKDPKRFVSLKPTLVKPNYQEVFSLLNFPIPFDLENRLQTLLPYKKNLFEKTHAEILAITADSEGSMILEKGKVPYRTVTKPVENIKAAGAGDTYTAAFTLSLTCGAPTKVAAEIAAKAAEIVVQKSGTATCSKEELLLSFVTQTKLLVKDELVFLIKRLKAEKKKIVFTNGCFDILHRGHIAYLNQAKQLGDCLIIGLNSDASVRRLKGKDRPVNTLSDRIQVLSGLSSVDYIIPFATNTPISLIQIIQPDIYVKGGDYQKDMLPEAETVENNGGKIEILPFIKDKSTTNIIRHIQNTVLNE
jgi:D-beta-D-heptose 7-phosphate kinase/D-beta-D-heptose 1-phosphate adenosyltransferase